MRADVRREDDVRNLVDKTVERFGRLDVAVNNAGTEGQPRPLTEQSAETYAASFDSARVTVSVAGGIVADTRQALTLREASYRPVQYIPRKDVDMTLLAISAQVVSRSSARAL